MKLKPQSTIRFVYPFAFDGDKFVQRVESVNQSSWGRLESVWVSTSFQVEDLLPSVTRYLQGSSINNAKAMLWKLDGNALQSTQGLASGAKNPARSWRLTQRKMHVPFRFISVNLLMFQVGIGFLVIEARPESYEPSQWFDFIHAFRFIGGGRGTRVYASRVLDDGNEEAFFPGIVNGANTESDGSGRVADLIDGMLASGGLKTDITRWWRDVFIAGQAIPNASLFFEDSDPEDDASHVYRLRNLFHSSQDLRLGPSDRDLSHDKLLMYVDRQWFVVSLDGVHFISFDPPDTPFFDSTLPGHLKKHYLHILIMALHQRFKLMEFSEEAARHWSGASTPNRVAAFERLNQEILSFRAQGLFAQIGQRDHLHRFYCKLHQVFEIEKQYLEVSEEVRDMHDYMQVAQAKRLEGRLNLLAVGLGIPGLVLGFLGINMLDVTSSEGLRWWGAALITVGASGILGFLGLKWLQKH